MRPKPPSPPRVAAAHRTRPWRSAARAVAAVAKTFEAGAHVPRHHHARAQLLFGVQGVMTVRAAGGLWIVPPSHALWVPAGVVHEIRMGGRVEMRTLYIEPRRMADAAKECQVLAVSPLLRELIVRAMAIAPRYDERGMEGRLMQLILDEVALLSPQPLGLRMPRDPRLARLCEAVLKDLSALAPIASLGAVVGLSERSVIRLFPKETGLTFGRWQKQARLLKAFELFDKGHHVTHVALELGYASPSAFSRMFRRTLGQAPIAMRASGLLPL
jgi:AraC-like DNA-binding protein/quercetin dioxygenase-like cupin family protein